jgi:mannonate dehydratase
MALWDIKGKRANMPVYDLLGGKVRDAVPMYAHADGREPKQVAENVRKYMEQGYRHVRAQMGGYGGGGMIPPGQGSRPNSGFKGAAFDEDVYLEEIPKLFEYLRASLGKEVKLLHDVHEHLAPTGAVELAKRMETVPHVLRRRHSASGTDRLVSAHQASLHNSDGNGRTVHESARIYAADFGASD